MGTYFDSNKQKSVNAYIKAAKGRKIVMSSGDVIVDPSSLWLCRNGVVYGRVYVKFRVKHGNIPSAKSELQNEVIYGNYTAVKNLSSKKRSHMQMKLDAISHIQEKNNFMWNQRLFRRNR